jgi:hypothetical protein
MQPHSCAFDGRLQMDNLFDWPNGYEGSSFLRA